jgi:rhodanese-related sulfurtransferase
MAGLDKHAIHLIDVRPPEAFEQYRIPGSIIIAPHAIRIRHFLKSKPIVLVNEGFALSQLGETCQSLNQAGFRATILAGGLAAWREKGGRLAGDPFAMQNMCTITAQQLAREARSAHHLIIDASEAKAPAVGNFAEKARTLSLMDDPGGRAKLKALIKEKSADPFLTVLVSAAADRENERIRRQLEAEGIRRIYFLQDGWNAYEQYLKERRTAARTVIHPAAVPGACSSCQ